MDTLKKVKQYYSKFITKTADLRTDAASTFEQLPKHIIDALENIHPDIINTYYGCGVIIPDCLENLTILDLGCGTGHDVYLLSQFVGENGTVIGIDMTNNQLHIATQYETYHQKKFGYFDKNTQFIKGYIEKLEGIDDNSVDLVISNCVVNLSKHKDQVFSEIYRVLKTGGEFYFSDVYSSQRISQKLQDDATLWNECLSGALYWNDYLHMVKKIGFTDPRLVKDKQILLKDDEIIAKTKNIDFYSATYRLFKLPQLEIDRENYGQRVIYKGTIKHNEKIWTLDNHNSFSTGVGYNVCGNTFTILQKSRFKQHFKFIDNHYHTGIFLNCEKSIPFSSSGKTISS